MKDKYILANLEHFLSVEKVNIPYISADKTVVG